MQIARKETGNQQMIKYTPLAIQGGPERTQQNTINNFKKTRDRIKQLCSLMRI